MTELTEEPIIPLHERRQIGLNYLSQVIEAMWGPRCNRHDGHCGCCVTWTIFDTMEKLTDTDLLSCDHRGKALAEQGDNGDSQA